MPRKSAKPDAAHSPSPQPSAATPAPGADEARGALRLGVQRIVSGGQTGVDRGALDAAIELGVEHGGWCPRGRLAEDGPIPARYQLRETEETEYAVRTESNVIDSDWTLVLYKDRLQRGTLLTYRLARRHARPALCVRLEQPVDVAKIQQWIIDEGIHVLNVAGPRASSSPGIDRETTEPAPGTDLDALRRKYISVTPLKLDLTHEASLARYALLFK